MPDKTITLTPAQAQRLIDTYYYVTEPDAVERLTRGELSLYDTPRGDLVEFECDVYGEPCPGCRWMRSMRSSTAGKPAH